MKLLPYQKALIERFEESKRTGKPFTWVRPSGDRFTEKQIREWYKIHFEHENTLRD